MDGEGVRNAHRAKVRVRSVEDGSRGIASLG